jgi:hypothetical protein
MAIYKTGSTENTDKNTRVMEPLSPEMVVNLDWKVVGNLTGFSTLQSYEIRQLKC